MNRVFVFEYLTGGGVVDADEAALADLAALGVAMRDAVAADLAATGAWAVSTAVSTRTPEAPRGTSPVQAQPGEASLDFVARQAALHDATWVIAPETEGVLLQLQRRVGHARWIGCDQAAVRTATSKRATLLRLAGRGIATPLAFERSPEVTQWVVKPDDGAGAVATHVHASRDAAWAEFEQRSRGGVAMTIEPWVDGEAMSLSLLCGADPAELLSINRQRIAISARGEVAFHGVDHGALPLNDVRGAVLQAIGMQVARAIPGLRGFVGIDLVWHPQRGPVIIEVNPRVTMAYVGLSAALGRNLAAEIMGMHATANAATQPAPMRPGALPLDTVHAAHAAA